MTMHATATAPRSPSAEETRLIARLNDLEWKGSGDTSRFLLYLRYATQIDERAAARLRFLARRYGVTQ